MNTQDKEMATWAVSALANVQITGNQAQNLLAVQGWLSQIAEGTLIAVDAESYKVMQEGAMAEGE